MNQDSMPWERPTLGFEGRRALVTGGGRGLGRQIVEALVQAGARVAAWDAPDWADAPMAYPLTSGDELAALSEELGEALLTDRVDVRDREAVAEAVTRVVDQLGGLDLLVIAAGVRTVALSADMTDAEWDAVVDTNLHGSFNVLRETVAHLESTSDARVVVVAAEEGRRGAWGLSHYAAAAWAQIGLAKSLALEVADQGVSINVVCPGPMETVMSDDPGYWAAMQAGRDGGQGPAVANREEAEHALRLRNPASTAYADPEAVVRSVLQLLGEPSQDLTGAVIDVSAGMAATNTA